MNRLEKLGYRIRISSWVGRLGNHLVQVSSAIYLAQMTRSLLEVPDHELITRRIFDFRTRDQVNCDEPISGWFLFSSECYQFPIRYDAERRRILQDFLYDFLFATNCFDKLKRHFNMAFRQDANSETLVINMRSGRDIFREEPPPQSDYMQPPLSFYQTIIETHGYGDCIVVTESDRANPVISELLSWRPDIRLKRHTSVRSDIETVLGANHLVMPHSSFTWCLALASKNLKVLHQWDHFPVRGLRGVDINTYKVTGYIKPGDWKGTPEQLELMVMHPKSLVSLCPKVDDSSDQPSAWM